MRILPILATAIGGAILSAVPAQASNGYRYADHGTVNPALYSFTATGNGALTGYYMGSTAAYDETLGVRVNGKTVASGVFANHGTPDFTSYDFGNVHAGDSLEFFIHVLNTNLDFSTITAKNADGLNHVFASAHPAEPWIGVPAGTFIGFEDLLGGGNLDYNDHTFVFTNVSFLAPTVPAAGTGMAGAVPEPATWAMMLLGFGAVGLVARQRRRTGIARAA
jgi:hypothetical protein